MSLILSSHSSAPVYNPRIKEKGFCPNPIAIHGIPYYADSIVNPDCVGTSAWREWWYEQFELCRTGYTTGGVFIPPMYYMYLNFYPISTVKRGRHLPDPVDADLEFFEEVLQAKTEGYGLIILKARRRGLSEKAGLIMRHGCLTNPEKYQAAIIAGLSDYSEELFSKFVQGNTALPPEMQVHQMVDEDKMDYEMAYWRKTITGRQVKDGSYNTVYARTVKNNPNVTKGSMLEDCFFEESGENMNLVPAYSASKKCYMDGDVMVGTPYIYGTGGKIKGGSKGFKEMVHSAKENNMKVLRYYGPRLRKPYYMGSTGIDGRVVTHLKNKTTGVMEEVTPNLNRMLKELKLSPEQLLGCEDVEYGTQKILEHRAIVIQQENKQPYYEALQDDPLNDEECFLSFNGNDYSAEKLSAQEMHVYQALGENPMLIRRYTMDFERDHNNMIKLPWNIILTPVREDERPDCWIEIYKMPEVGYSKLYCQGIDGYDIDLSTTSDSIGASVVMTRANNSPGGMVKPKQVQSVIRCRPRRKETFYLYCMMQSILYGTLGATMADARSPGVIAFYIAHGCEKYLATRPTAFDTARTEQHDKYGFKMTPNVRKPLMAMMQSWVEDFVQWCYFLPLIRDIRNFDKEADDSDWDAHDALQLALLCDFSIGIPARNQEEDSEDAFALVSWREQPNGVMAPDREIIEEVSSFEDDDPWGYTVGGSPYGNLEAMDY